MGNTDALKILLSTDRSTLEDKENIRSSTPLILAVQRVHYDAVDYLLSLGADVNCTAESIKLRPLHCAATGGIHMLAILLKNKADVSARADISCFSSLQQIFITVTRFLELVLN